MKELDPYVYLFDSELNPQKLMNIERNARICYKSEDRMGSDLSQGFLKRILANGHESVIEHEKVTVYFVVDRGVSHELVRHRIASFSQESTRYCNYEKDKFGKEISVITPFYYKNNSEAYNHWKDACESAERAYLSLVSMSAPQEARSVLPNSLKTEIAVTFNLREWRHFFSLRASAKAHPQMQQVTIPLLLLFKQRFSPLFDNIEYNISFPMEHYAEVKIIH